MSDQDIYNLQNTWLMLGLCLFLALVLVGLLLRKTRFWDHDKTLSRERSLSIKASIVMLSAGGIGTVLCLLFLIGNITGLLSSSQ